VTEIRTAARPGAFQRLFEQQTARNQQLLQQTPLLGAEIRSEVLPFALDLKAPALPDDAGLALAALEKTAAAIAIESLISLAKVNDIDHLGGGLELIGPLLMTLAAVDYRGTQFSIEHGHTSIGYYAALSALGFLPRERVVESFRRSLDVAGHVVWVPGGTPIGSGRLGITVPVTTGWALGLKAAHGQDALVFCHTGDAGWISGQALNGLLGASMHGAPVVLVMHRNGIQLSGTTARVTGKDPRTIAASLGIEVVELASLHDRAGLFAAYRQAAALARGGKPALIYPVGISAKTTVRDFGIRYGILKETEHFAEKHKVAIDTPVRIPGSLMSYRDAHAMLECLFYVNELPGGEAHHDGGMKGRDGAAVLGNPMLQLTAEEKSALDRLRRQSKRVVIEKARPRPGSPNLLLSPGDVAGIALPGTDKPISPRVGSEAAYAAIAKKYGAQCFFVSCDLNPSTRLGKAASLVPPGHAIEMSIQEQAATLLTNGLSLVADRPQLNVFATFAAFMEGIAREGFEFWRYQRNLNGVNEGLNVVLHLSHVGANTGRDHFAGWSLDWITLALGYLPFLHRVYAPADARAAFIAVRDAAAHYGGHIVAIPRDTLPVLTRQNSGEPLWQADEPWSAVTQMRAQPNAKTAVLAIGAPAYLAAAASDKATAAGVPTDSYVVNGLPLPDGFFAGLASRYTRVLTIEDGLIGTPASGLRGFAGLASSSLASAGVALQHFGIVDPSVAPSETFDKVWEHFGISEQHLLDAVIEQR